MTTELVPTSGMTAIEAAGHVANAYAAAGAFADYIGRKSDNTLDAQRARLDQVKAGTALTGSLSASTTRNSGADQSYSTAFTVTKLLSDSGKNALERRSQGLAIDTASESQREAILAVRKGVKDAYYTLLLNGLKREQAANGQVAYRPVYVLRKAEMTGEALSSASVEIEPMTGRVHVSLCSMPKAGPSSPG